jgi:hypothetical protein
MTAIFFGSAGRNVSSSSGAVPSGLSFAAAVAARRFPLRLVVATDLKNIADIARPRLNVSL